MHVTLQIVGWALDVIGAFGIPDDLATAATVVAIVQPYLDSFVGRAVCGILGTTLLVVLYGRWYARWRMRRLEQVSDDREPTTERDAKILPPSPAPPSPLQSSHLPPSVAAHGVRGLRVHGNVTIGSLSTAKVQDSSDVDVRDNILINPESGTPAHDATMNMIMDTAHDLMECVQDSVIDHDVQGNLLSRLRFLEKASHMAFIGTPTQRLRLRQYLRVYQEARHPGPLSRPEIENIQCAFESLRASIIRWR